MKTLNHAVADRVIGRGGAMLATKCFCDGVEELAFELLPPVGGDALRAAKTGHPAIYEGARACLR